METRRQRRLHAAAADEQVHNVLIKQEVEWVAEDSHAPDLVNQQVELDMESTRFIYTEEDPYYNGGEAHVVQEFTPVPQTDEYIKAELDLGEEFRDEIIDSEENCKELVIPLASDQQLKVSKSAEEMHASSSAQKAYLNIHMHTNHLDKYQSIIQFECEFCSRMFKKKNDFKRHLSTHGEHGKQEFLCDLCEKTFPNKISFRRHHKVHAKKGRNKFKASKITSEVSRSSCTEKKKLRNHMIRKHSGKAPSNTSGPHTADNEAANTRTEEFLDQEATSHEQASRESAAQGDESTEYIQIHMRLAHSKPKHKCEFCSRLFKKKSHLESHRSTHAAKRKRDFACDICERAFYTKSNLNDHKKAYAQKEHPKFTCEECSSSFTKKGDLDAHMLSKHSEKSQQIIQAPDTPEDVNQEFICELCERTFSNKISLRTHHKVHAKKGRTKFKASKFTCEVCGSSFTEKKNLRIHMVRKHLGKGQSNTSGPQTADVDSMDSHMEEFLDGETPSHGQTSQESGRQNSERQSDTKSEACDVCHFIYPTEYISAHMRLEHSEPKHKCEFCSRLFKRKSNLDAHLSTHATDRKRTFVCDICERAYYDKGHLNAHKKRYAQKDHPKFNCERCLSRFNRKGDLDVHLLTKHLEKSQPIIPASQTVEDDDSIDTGTEEFLDEESASNEQPSQESIRKDIEKKSDIKSEACEICHGFYPTEYIQTHMRSAHSKPKHKCEFCSRLFKKKSHLERHLSTHSTNRRRDFACDICERSFYIRSHLNDHMKAYAEKEHPKFKCKVCRSSFTRKGDLDVHMLTKHLEKSSCCGQASQECVAKVIESRSGVKSETCEVCHCIYPIEYIRTHIRLAHSTPEHYFNPPKFKCELCPRSFYNRTFLNRHLSTHSTNRKRDFACDICERTFYENSKLVRHMKLYAQKDHPKFNCKACRSSFKYKGNLEKHMLTKHLDKTQSITPDPQTAADYSINTNQILRNKRTERETLKCGVCWRTFKSTSILKRHFSAHSKDRKRNFSCDVCERKFYTQRSLWKHMQTYARKDHPKIDCKVCCSSFTKKGDLVEHMLTKHLDQSQPITPAPQTATDDSINTNQF